MKWKGLIADILGLLMIGVTAGSASATAGINKQIISRNKTTFNMRNSSCNERIRVLKDTQIGLAALLAVGAAGLRLIDDLGHDKRIYVEQYMVVYAYGMAQLR